MSSDDIQVRTPVFSFGLSKKEHQTILKNGDTLIVREWKWRRFGYIKKAVTIQDGKIHIQVIK